MTVKKVKNNLFNHYMINGKKNNLEIYKKKSPFSLQNIIKYKLQERKCNKQTSHKYRS